MNVELCHNHVLNVQGFIIIEIPPNSTVSVVVLCYITIQIAKKLFI